VGEAFLRVSSDNLRGGSEVEVPVVGVFTFGREGKIEALACFQASLLEDPPHVLVGGSGIGGRFEDDELPLAKMLRYHLRGIEHIAHVRLAVPVERRGNADKDAIHNLQLAEIGCWGKVC